MSLQRNFTLLNEVHNNTALYHHNEDLSDNPGTMLFGYVTESGHFTFSLVLVWRHFGAVFFYSVPVKF